MKTTTKLLVAALALLVLAQWGEAQENKGVTLRYKFAKDKKLIYRKTTAMTQKQLITVNNKETKIETKVNGSDVSQWTFERVDDKGNLHVRTQNKSLKVSMSIGPLGKYSYDSASDKNDKTSQIGQGVTPVYDALSGASLQLVISPRGEVQELIGYKELMGNLLENNPLGAQLSGASSEKAAKMNFAEFFVVMSKEPVREGDKWETPFKLELPKIGAVDGKNIYTYDGIERKDNRKLAKISVATEMSFDLKLKTGDANITGNMSVSNSSGTILFDVENGHVTNMKREFTIGGNLSVSVNGMDIPINTEQTQKISMEKLDSLP